MYGNVLASEKMEILYSINPNMKKISARHRGGRRLQLRYCSS